MQLPTTDFSSVSIGDMPRTSQKEPVASGFGQRLRQARLAKGVTQVQLAERMNTTQRAITYYENEAEYPPAVTIVTLAKELGVSTDELLGHSHAPAARTTKASNHSAAPQEPAMRRLWKKFQQIANLPDKDQRAVIRLVNSLAAH